MSNKQFFRMSERTGMHFGLAGVAVALIGAVLGFSIAPVSGYWIASVGVLMGIVGAVLHRPKN